MALESLKITFIKATWLNVGVGIQLNKSKTSSSLCSLTSDKDAPFLKEAAKWGDAPTQSAL